MIAKPYVGECSHNVELIRNAEELAHARQKTDTLIQQYVGDENTEYTVSCFVDRNGMVLGSFVFRRTLWNGVSVRCEVDRNETIIAAGEAIAARLNARGSLNIQMRMHEGEAFCIEINARFSGTTGVRAHFGFNDVDYTLRHYLLGNNLDELPVIHEGIALRYFDEVFPK